MKAKTRVTLVHSSFKSGVLLRFLKDTIKLVSAERKKWERNKVLFKVLTF